MRIRVFPSGKLDLDTVTNMLTQTDAQANFHPEARWISSCTLGSTSDWSYIHEKKVNKGRLFKDIFVRWIGREAVTMWLCNNQILFEVMSFDLLPEEVEAIDGTIMRSSANLNHIN
jgi:hypothetical protein